MPSEKDKDEHETYSYLWLDIPQPTNAYLKKLRNENRMSTMGEVLVQIIREYKMMQEGSPRFGVVTDLEMLEMKKEVVNMRDELEKMKGLIYLDRLSEKPVIFLEDLLRMSANYVRRLARLQGVAGTRKLEIISNMLDSDAITVRGTRLEVQRFREKVASRS
jgi:hypothetical protein